ncbi:MaoC/PaaZ C-terminal domain-containing protein [Glaciecola sp. SC05]|uniref:MaoC/PaaZ C-terminal domain-containing protein n=1 Tax=Glaciecola sp. SC05 TaxID=1987355 RepID=UPI00352726B7
MNIAQLSIGTAMSTPDWFQVTQKIVNDFADVTGDFQWIHLDQQRCATESPFRTTIAHGFLTAALMPQMFAKCVSIDASRYTMLNYGIDGLRYLESVRVDDKIRFGFSLTEIEQKPTGKLHRFATHVEIEGRDKPALVGEFLMLLIENPA